MKQIIKSLITIFIIIGVLYLFENYQKYFNQPKIEIKKDLEIYFLDVGEGDSILIRNQNKNILIDAGNNKDGPKIVKFLEKLNIKELEYLITTHSHEDHIGGMDDIIRKFKINHFYIPDVELEIITYKEVINLLKKKNIEIEIPKIGDTFQINNLLFEIIWVGNDPENLNENSIVIRLKYQDTSYLFMADAPIEVEKQILDKKIESDVLKVGHHGSRYSTSDELLEKVNPKYAIISVEKDNDYHFPHQGTINRLEKRNIKIYRTDLDHTIYLISNGKEINISSLETDTNYLDENIS